MTVNEIDRFIEKLESTEPFNDMDMDDYKGHAIACLKNLCDWMEYKNIKSMKIRDVEE